MRLVLAAYCGTFTSQVMDILSIVMAPFAVAYMAVALTDSQVLVHVFKKLYPKKFKNVHTREQLRYSLMGNIPPFVHDLMHCKLCQCIYFSAPLLLGGASLYTALGVAGLGYTVIKLWEKLNPASNEESEEEEKTPEVIEPNPVVPQTKEDKPLSTEDRLLRQRSPVHLKDAPKDKFTSFKGYNFKLNRETNEWELQDEDPNREEIEQFFKDPDSWCKGLGRDCEALAMEYKQNIKDLRSKAEANNVKCSKCETNAIENTFYQKLKQFLASSD